MKKRRAIILLAIGIGLVWLGIRWANSALSESAAGGLVEGRLAACPESPNCVSTSATDVKQWIEPIALVSPAADARETLLAVLRAMPRATIVVSEPKYVRAEFRSLLFGFVDDAEFVIDEEARHIEFRSASRVGHSDLGANRARMEELRRRFQLQTTARE